MPQQLRILAVGAHPDDIEGYCGGTLARYAQAGHHVMMAHATNGDKGHMVIPPAELAVIREQEARAAAVIIGAEFFWMGFHDAELFYDEPTRLAFIDLLRRARPDVIFTHWPEGYHPDHIATGQLVAGANYLSSLPHIQTAHPPTAGPALIYYMDVHHDIRAAAAEYVDVTSVYEIKRQMFACHQSQLVWLREHDGIDILAEMAARDGARGAQCGVTYAESFVPRGFRLTYRVLP